MKRYKSKLDEIKRLDPDTEEAIIYLQNKMTKNNQKG